MNKLKAIVYKPWAFAALASLVTVVLVGGVAVAVTPLGCQVGQKIGVGSPRPKCAARRHRAAPAGRIHTAPRLLRRPAIAILRPDLQRNPRTLAPRSTLLDHARRQALRLRLPRS